MRYPPCGHMLVMMTASTDGMTAMLCIELLAKKIQQAQERGKLSGVQMIGPADAAVAKLKDVYRRVLYFKHSEYETLVQMKDVLEQYIYHHREFRNVTVQFDFDPMNGF